MYKRHATTSSLFRHKLRPAFTVVRLEDFKLCQGKDLLDKSSLETILFSHKLIQLQNCYFSKAQRKNIDALVTKKKVKQIVYDVRMDIFYTWNDFDF